MVLAELLTDGEHPLYEDKSVVFENRMLNTSVSGVIMVTNYRILFLSATNEAELLHESYCSIPLTCIEKVSKKKMKLVVECKDVRTVAFRFSSVESYDNFIKRFKVFSSRPKDKVFAWDNMEPFARGCPFVPFVPEAECDRIFHRFRSFWEYWRLTKANELYQLCDTYGAELCVPANLTDAQIIAAADYRSRSRLPIMSYVHHNGASISRSAQPKSGMMQNKSKADIEYMNELVDTNPRTNSNLYIVDARPKINAAANRAAGAGYENTSNYRNTSLHFLNIDNIHVMRSAYKQLKDVCMQNETDSASNFLTSVDSSQWLQHISRIIAGASTVTHFIASGANVLVHCSDGWDRTSQLTSLAMIMLDSYYRTIDGLMCLVQKEWIYCGHKFADRVGHDDFASDSERSPVFLQFLDCVWQIQQQNPSSFEFTEALLLDMSAALFSCRFGNFILNCEKDRDEFETAKKTACFWTYCDRRRKRYFNPNHDLVDKILVVSSKMKNIRLWRSYFLQYMTRSTIPDEDMSNGKKGDDDKQQSHYLEKCLEIQKGAYYDLKSILTAHNIPCPPSPEFPPFPNQQKPPLCPARPVSPKRSAINISPRPSRQNERGFTSPTLRRAARSPSKREESFLSQSTALRREIEARKPLTSSSALSLTPQPKMLCLSDQEPLLSPGHPAPPLPPPLEPSPQLLQLSFDQQKREAREFPSPLLLSSPPPRVAPHSPELLRPSSSVPSLANPHSMPSSDRLVPSLGRSQGMSEEFSGWKSDDSIVKRGYLTKRGLKRKNWKTRWFVLSSNQVRYFSSPVDQVPKGSIALSVTTKIEEGSKKDSFQIVNLDRVLSCKAETPFQAKEWLDALHAVIASLNKDSSHGTGIREIRQSFI